MKSKHILHIGYPKTGTSWLWNNLITHPDISVSDDKEDYFLINGGLVSEYVEKYNDIGQITLNFCPGNVFIDRYLIDQLSCYDTIVVSITVRNPYDLLFSLLNKLNIKVEIDQYAEIMLNQGPWFLDAGNNIKRWKEFFGNRVNIFLYDDLQNDQQLFYQNYLLTIGLNSCIISVTERSNTTNYFKEKIEIPRRIKNQINSYINNLENVLEKDLSGWRRD